MAENDEIKEESGLDNQAALADGADAVPPTGGEESPATPPSEEIDEFEPDEGLDDIEKRRLTTQKVELDTAGLDLELDEAEPAPDDEVIIEGAAEEEAEEEKPGRPKWFWPVVLGGTVIIVVALVMIVGHLTWWAKEEVALEEAVKPEVVMVEEGMLSGLPSISLKDFMVPLTEPKRTQLRISINLSLTSEEAKGKLEKEETKLRDTVYRVLLASDQGRLRSKNKRKELKEAILKAVNEKLDGSPVKQIFFTEFLVL